MKKKIILSVFALIYLTVFKITDFEFGGIGLATILGFLVPFFVLLSLILFILSLYSFYRKDSDNSDNFVILISNLVSLILTFDVFFYFLNPVNW